jgi:hypothetical protein
MKKKYYSILAILALSFSITVSVHTEDTVPEIVQPEVIDTTTSTPEEVTENQPEIPEDTTTTSTEDIAVETPLDLPTTTAKLYAVANGTILFQKTIEVTACKPYGASAEYTLNAKCLIDQAEGLSSAWDFYGTDAFLSSINGYSNDFGANLFWGYFINNEYASVALNAYTLNEDDEILLQYNTIPLKLELSTTTPVVGDSIIISINEFGLDEFWNPIWIPSTSSTLTINEEVTFVSSSTANLPITTTSPYTIRVEKNGYITQEITLTAGAVPTPVTPPSSGSGGGGSGSSGQNSSGAESMINFLDAEQNTNGSFGTTAFLSDWAAIAYGAWTGDSLGESKLTNYLLTNPNPLDGPNETTNYARRAMALMALGINPYTGTQTNYISEIIKKFDGTQFGEVGLINDDIFALTPLLRSGYSTNDALIVSTTKYIIANQDTHGSFGSIDLTGAAVQTLSELSLIEGVSEALTKAKNYLTLAQQTDGGFGNVYATGWVMQGIAALGENTTNWNNNGNTPVTYIQSKQASDGGMLVGDTDANRIWATSYALPGLLGKPWHTILTSFNKPSNSTGSTGSSDTTESTTSTTTTTSTPIVVTTPTSTPTSTTTTSTTTEVIPEEPTLYAYTEVTQENFQAPTYSEPTRTAVLGEKEENTEVTNEPIVEENKESTVTTSTNESVSEDPQTKKYLFITSLIIFLILIGYMVFKQKS